MPEDYVIPHVNEHEPMLCSVCDKYNVVGLKLMERVFNNRSQRGFVCINCVANMWNTPSSTPLEPTAEERKKGTPVLEQMSVSDDPFPEMYVGKQIDVDGVLYRVVHVHKTDAGNSYTVELW